MKLGLTDRLQSHWRGELNLWMVFFYCPFLILAPACLAITIELPIALLHTESTEVSFMWLYCTSMAATDAMAFWWCWGTVQKSLRMLSMNKLFAALPVFTIGFCTAILVILELLPMSYSSVSEIITEVRMKREMELKSEKKDLWTKIPWTVTAQPELRRFIAQGKIGFGSSTVLEKEINENPQLTLLEINSPGGLVHEENLIVDIILKQKMDTLVLEKCASACTGVFLAGVRRYVGPNARFGFHQSGFEGRKDDTIWDIAEYEASILYRAQGVSEEFIRQALNISYYSLWKPDILDVKLNGFATDWWIERPEKYK